MNIRPKTVRRLMILFLAMVLVSGVIASWLLLSQRRLRGQIDQQRIDAIAAYNARDYTTAVNLFRDYLNRSHTQDADAEAMFDYAKSRMNAATEGSRHIFEAIGVFERYLQMGSANDPRGATRRIEETSEANHLLLSLYVQAKYTKEAIRVANGLLAANPGDVDALQNLVRALQTDGKPGPALDACRKLNGLIPPDLDWQMTELRLLSATGKPNDQVMARARELSTAHPDDATFAALLSWANLAFGNDPAGAKLAIQAAAKLPPGKAETVLQIVRLLDVQQEFASADDLLNRATDSHPDDASILRASVERAWQRQSPAEVLKRVEKTDAKTAGTALLGYKALAYFQTNRAEQAAPLLETLAGRKDDVSRAWHIALQTQFGHPPVTPAEAVRKLTEATLRDPSNPVFWFFLGQQWARLGETDQAMRAWTAAAQHAPPWALPYVLICRSLCDSGRFPEALRAAELGRLRAPGAQPVETSYALAWYGLQMSGANGPAASAEGDSLFALIETIQKAWKNEPTTLSIYASLLARRGRQDEAAAVIKGALATDPALPADTLVQLSAVSHESKLGLEDELLDRAEKAYGLTPPIAVARAMLLVDAGKTPEGLALFEKYAAKHVSDAQWQLAGARLHDAAASPEAPERWADLGKRFSDNLHVQYAILQSSAHLKNRDLWRQTIDRVKSLTGSDGIGWQLEDARWRLAGEPADTEVTAIVAALQKIASAARSLPDVHRLLAEAILRSDDAGGVTRAVGELTVAHELCPGDFETTSRLAQLLLTQGMRDRSQALVDAVAAQPDLAAPRRLWAAAMYADLGKIDQAIALLNAAPDSATRPAREGLLARLYRRAGRTQDAAAQYQKVLADPASTFDSLAAGAEFYAGLRQPEVTEQFLARIEKTSSATGGVELLRARVQQIAGQSDKAIATLVKATKSHPQSEQTWQQLSGLYLRAGRLDDADRSAAEGVSAIGGSKQLTAMRTQIARVRILTPGAIAPLIDVISNEPDQPVADKAMALLADAKSRGTTLDQVLPTLRSLADQNTGFVPLQKLLAERYAAAGRLKEATDIAARASAASPEDVDGLRLLCALQTASGNWEAARQTALRWKQLAGQNTLDADIVIALSYLRQSRPDAPAAVAQLAPFVSDNSPEADRTAALPLYCTALVSVGKADQARSLLEPLVGASVKWQSVWLELAAAHRDESAATAWISKFTDLVKTDTPDRIVALAGAWEQVGSRFDSAAAYKQARTLLQPIVNAPGAPARAWPAWAGINQAVENLPEAERAWREYLKTAPASPLAKNNLAYVLMLQGHPPQLVEAEQLARAAIATDPGVSTLYDTLARIQLRAGKPDDAIKSFRSALDRNASNVDAMIGLAEILQARPQNRDEAKSLLSRIDAAMRDGTPVASNVRKQLERVKSALSSSSL